jgi:signal transduction histidine kinase
MRITKPIATLYRRALVVAFWITTALGIVGNLLDLCFLEHSVLLKAFNTATIVVILSCVVGFLFFRKLLYVWFAVIGYAIIINSWFFLIKNSGLPGDISAFFLRETIIVALLLMSLAFVSHRINSLILGFAYVFLAIIVSLRSGNSFLLDNIYLLVIVFSAYSIFVFLFSGLLKTTINELNNQYIQALKNNEELQNINTRIEEQQQHIEEQKEELEALLETVRMKNADLEEAGNTKNKFFNIIAHDLRNPAGAIEGFANILVNRENLDEEKQSRYISIIHKASVQLTTLLENLLQWARSQTGRITPQPVHFPIERIISNVTHSLESGLSQKQVQINVSVNWDAIAYADPMMTETIVRNIMSNAIKYSYRGSSIHIFSTKKGSEIIVEVKDQGTGLSATKVGKLMRSEHEPSEHGTEDEEGTGLGLLVCKEFIRINKGRFWINSELGKGSTFGFSLPVNGEKGNLQG